MMRWCFGLSHSQMIGTVEKHNTLTPQNGQYVLGDCQIAKVSNEADFCILTSSEMATFWGGEKHVRFLKVSNQHQWWNLVEI